MELVLDAERREDMTTFAHEDPMLAAISASDDHPSLGITTSQKMAAKLLLDLGDAQHVDAVLGLEPGTVARWESSKPFQENLEHLRSASVACGTPEVDYSKALDPKRAEAARLLVLDHLTQEEVGDKVGVTARAIRDWKKTTVFKRYAEQLQREKELGEQEARKAGDDEVAEILRSGRVDAALQLVQNARNGDPRAIFLLLKAKL
jgi:transcriptional regulator with XRE-family HTH domain